MTMRYVHELLDSEEMKIVTFDKDCFFIPRRAGAVGKTGARRNLKINILALGDVGATLLLGLRLLGGDVCNTIGVRDLSNETEERYVKEINQIVSPEEGIGDMPEVLRVSDDELYQCDILVFCATAGIPSGGDVRMAQYKANKRIMESCVEAALSHDFSGSLFIVSDPVDPLCQVAVNSGIRKDRVRGFGLGVMHARALYYDDTKIYAREGRVFGPHGQGLVVANSVKSYEHQASMELTAKTVMANTKVRELGFKPYIAPALSSGALSILAAIRGSWHYSALSFGAEFLGVRNKWMPHCDVIEDLALKPILFDRINTAYQSLKRIK